MKKFYAWYQKHITGAIFTGLILGILTGLLLADRFTPINCHGHLQHRKCKNDR